MIGLFGHRHINTLIHISVNLKTFYCQKLYPYDSKCICHGFRCLSFRTQLFSFQDLINDIIWSCSNFLHIPLSSHSVRTALPCVLRIKFYRCNCKHLCLFKAGGFWKFLRLHQKDHSHVSLWNNLPHFLLPVMTTKKCPKSTAFWFHMYITVKYSSIFIKARKKTKAHCIGMHFISF